jgi:uncharacterized membrane protein YoaT (DUF817 family)
MTEEKEKPKDGTAIVIVLIIGIFVLLFAILIGTVFADWASPNQVKTITVAKIERVSENNIGIVDTDCNFYYVSNWEVKTYLEEGKTFSVEVEDYPYGSHMHNEIQRVITPCP